MPTPQSELGTARGTVGPTYADRVRSIAASTRGITRAWFDVLAPLAMLAVLYTQPIPWTSVVIGGAAVVFLHLGATLISDAVDVDVDAASEESSRRTRVLVTGAGRPRDFTAVGATLLVLGIAASFQLGYVVGALVLLASALAVAYSTPPLSLCARPVWPQVMWPIVWLIMFAAIAVVCHSQHWSSALGFSVFVALFMGVGEGITQDIHDVDNDLAGGRRTTPGVLGVFASAVTAVGAQTLSVLPWLWFCATFPLSRPAAALGTAVVLTWLVIFVILTAQLRGAYIKRLARWTHHGSIYAFSLVNVIVIVSVVFSHTPMR